MIIPSIPPICPGFFATLITAALLALTTQLAEAQSSDGSASNPSRRINVQVSLDLSLTGRERCVVEPEDLNIPRGRATVNWSLAVQRAESAQSPRITHVGFPESIPVDSIERLTSQQWQAGFDQRTDFEKVPYDVFVEEADGTVTECYPHIAGSTDQGG